MRVEITATMQGRGRGVTKKELLDWLSGDIPEDARIQGGDIRFYAYWYEER